MLGGGSAWVAASSGRSPFALVGRRLFGSVAAFHSRLYQKELALRTARPYESELLDQRVQEVRFSPLSPQAMVQSHMDQFAALSCDCTMPKESCEATTMYLDKVHKLSNA